jgi:uncharacterized alkaline shock family protein YloU
MGIAWATIRGACAWGSSADTSTAEAAGKAGSVMTEQEENTQQQQESPLRTERGTTTIQDGVVAKVVGIAAQEIEGVRMGGGASQAVGTIVSALPGVSGSSESQGVSVEVGEVEAAADLTMRVEYGRTIHRVAEEVRRHVIRRVENLVGLHVTEVNIMVSDVFFPQEEEDQQQQR